MKREHYEAFHKAADHIEANPRLYMFRRITTPDDGCTACMWGWVGHFLNMAGDINIEKVARKVGVDGTERLYEFSRPYLVKFHQDEFKAYGYIRNAKDAARSLRHFADSHYDKPAKPVLTEIPDNVVYLFKDVA